MKHILHILSSPRGEQSVSIKLGNSIANSIAAKHPGSTITEVNLVTNPFPHLDESQVLAMRTPEAQLTPELAAVLKRSDDAIAQLFAADELVISLPFFNFGIPSALKTWIDNIARAGKTFSYGENGPQGLVTGKKVYIAIATGGVYSAGPMAAYDFAIPHLTSVLAFIGLTDVEVVRAEGTVIPGLQEHALEKALESLAL